MKSQVLRPRGLMILVSAALLSAFAGTALAGGGKTNQAMASDRSSRAEQIAKEQFASDPARTRRRGGQHVRTGRIVDHDTTLGDGNWNFATGHAECKRGERIVTGGVRRIASTGLIPGLRWALQESAPEPQKRRWSILAASDLGGLGRSDFVVVVVCE
jgi:hypothetical protein